MDTQAKNAKNDPATARAGEIAHTVRQVYGVFARNVPPAAQSSGVYQPEKSSALAGKYDVPDGVYRITGYDWLLEFKRGRLTVVQRARPDFDGSKVIEVAAAHY